MFPNVLLLTSFHLSHFAIPGLCCSASNLLYYFQVGSNFRLACQAWLNMNLNSTFN